MFTTVDDIQSTLLCLLTRQHGNETTCPILAAAIMDLHALMLMMDAAFTQVIWANEGAE